MHEQGVDNVKLPKFRIESSFQLENVLPQMGITYIFSSGDSHVATLNVKITLNVKDFTLRVND